MEEIANLFHGFAVVIQPFNLLVMLVGNNRKIMGKHTNGVWLNGFGWAATAVTTVAAIIFLVGLAS